MMNNESRQNDSSAKIILKKVDSSNMKNNTENKDSVQEKIKNPGYYFWRGYFKDNPKEQREKLCKCDFNALKAFSEYLVTEDDTKYYFELKTQYPGLVTGIGLPHEIQGDNTFILGFCFDYTTGLPIIPGSTVKGVLRSVFPQWEKHLKEPQQKKKAKTDYIYDLMGSIPKSETNSFLQKVLEDIKQEKQDEKKFESKKELITLIENEIFEGVVGNKNVGTYKRDLFFDAYIVRGTEKKPAGDLIFGIDNITPHVQEGMSYEESMLKNPKPLSFLKILPDVVFHFPFFLTDGILKKKEKEELFKQILLNIGIGAKTNVGYGQFEENITEEGNSAKK